MAKKTWKKSQEDKRRKSKRTIDKRKRDEKIKKRQTT